MPILPSKNGNILVYDLRHDPEKLLEQENLYPIVKELCLNKCPAVAPISVLDKHDGWKKIGLNKEIIERNWQTLNKHPELIERLRAENEKAPEFPKSDEPEGAIYDGFLNDRDRIKVAAVRNADENRLADFHPDFDDERLPGLLLHYKGRNFPQTLSEQENEEWERYRLARLAKKSQQFLSELAMVKDDFVREELRLYFESLI